MFPLSTCQRYFHRNCFCYLMCGAIMSSLCRFSAGRHSSTRVLSTPKTGNLLMLFVNKVSSNAKCLSATAFFHKLNTCALYRTCNTVCVLGVNPVVWNLQHLVQQCWFPLMVLLMAECHYAAIVFIEQPNILLVIH